MKQNTPACPKQQPYFKTIISHTVVFILFAALIILLLNRGMYTPMEIPQYHGTVNYTEPAWVFKQGDAVLEESLEVPAYRHMKTGDTFSISTRLTYDGQKDENPYCFYFVDHMYTRAFLDGEKLFSYYPEDVHKFDRSKSPGNIYVSFQLPPDCQGKELVIEFLPVLSESIEFGLPSPYFGDYGSTIISTFWHELPHNIVVILAAFIGLATVMFATFVLSGSMYREALFIGIFATLFSLYNLTESNFDFYAISNPYFTYVLDYVTFTLVPVFLLAFLRERLNEKRRWPATVMIVVGVLMFAAEMILHGTGILDMREFLPLLHIAYFADMVIIFILLITMKRNKWKRQLILQMIPILCGMVLDVAVYYAHWNLDSSDSSFSSFGVIIFLIIELYHAWKYSIEVYAESVRSRNYQQMAYVDSLTGIGNRRAFDMEMDAARDRRREYKSLVVASVDVNGLKAANDNYGHAAGDFLIRTAANVLSNLTEGCGRAFRTGGDEFVLFLYDIDKDEFEHRLDEMGMELNAINATSNPKLSFALGYALSNGEDLETALSTADKQMYAIKMKYKASVALN